MRFLRKGKLMAAKPKKPVKPPKKKKEFFGSKQFLDAVKKRKALLDSVSKKKTPKKRTGKA